MIDDVTRRNLASPDYEPSDADLVELMREAFAGVREANEESLRRLRERIAARGAEVLAALERQLQASGGDR